MKAFKKLLAFVCVSASSLFAQGAVQEEVSAVILGGGVGAYTSAIYLSRAGIVPYVVEGPTPGGTITQSPHVQNWPGELEISGFDLAEKVRNQARANGAQLMAEEVVSVDFSKKPFEITVKAVEGKKATRTLLARTCIIAFGTQVKYLGVEGEKKYWSRGVYNCAICDGSLYRDKTVVVVGGGDAAILEADYLSNIAKKVVVVVRGGAFRTVEDVRKNQLLAKKNVQVFFNSQVREIQGDEVKVTKIAVQEKGKAKEQILQTDAVFLAIGSQPNTAIFRGQLKLDEKGFIVVDAHQRTSVEGVYAIGDVADPFYKQAISAAGDGAKAAIEVQGLLAKRGATQPLPVQNKGHVLADSHGVIEIKNKEHFRAVLRESSVPVLVDFYATWCPPCKRFSPTYDRWAKEHGEKFLFLKVNADQVRDLCQEFQITALPTLALFDQQGKLLERFVGSQEITHFGDRLDQSKGQVATSIGSS